MRCCRCQKRFGRHAGTSWCRSSSRSAPTLRSPWSAQRCSCSSLSCHTKRPCLHFTVTAPSVHAHAAFAPILRGLQLHECWVILLHGLHAFVMPRLQINVLVEGFNEDGQLCGRSQYDAPGELVMGAGHLVDCMGKLMRAR